MTALETIDNAIQMAEERLAQIQDFTIFDSIVQQLYYLKAIVEKREKDRSKLTKVIVGHYAVHEFEETDPKFSRVLKDCQNIAYQLSKGRVV